jgi:hypothetical protein
MRTPGKEFLLSRRDREGRFTLRKIHHVPRVSRSKDITSTILLATVTIVLSRTRERGARNETFGISSGTIIHSRPIPLWLDRVLDNKSIDDNRVSMAKCVQNYSTVHLQCIRGFEFALGL